MCGSSGGVWRVFVCRGLVVVLDVVAYALCRRSCVHVGMFMIVHVVHVVIMFRKRLAAAASGVVSFFVVFLSFLFPVTCFLEGRHVVI